MRISLLIVGVFVVGAAAGYAGVVPERIATSNLSTWALYALVFLVGVGIGGSGRATEVLHTVNYRMALVPLSVMVGTFAGVSLLALLVPGFDLRESLAVGAGFGYYSLSSVLIRKYSVTLAAVALLANIFREIVTLVAAPVLAKRLYRLAPVSIGGATTMDTTLPILTQFTGKEYALICVFNGLVLSLAVPVLVPLILSL